MTTVYLATDNPHKVEELSAMFEREALAIQVKSADEIGGMPEVEETEQTFEGNAMLKVEALASKVGPGNYALADDSGLEVDALQGAPGVISARFAGEDATDIQNLVKLMILVSQIPEKKRGAQFVCSLVLMNSEGFSESYLGICRGVVIQESRGDEGFGYDPMFIPGGYELTFGELGWDVKSNISHRARALQQLVSWFRKQNKSG
tara:strand:- start:996 stop:1610 length:615 start_codon:yes stop_codon:yes gene_type:complete